MAGKRKERSLTKKIEFNIEEGMDIASLVEFSKTDEAKELGFFTSPDGTGFTVGKGLSSFEEEEEGLPDGVGDEMTFDFRVVLDQGGAVELQIARRGAGRRSRFRIEDLPNPSDEIEKDGRRFRENRQLRASNRFLINLDTALSFYSYLLLKAYLAEKESLSKKRKLYDKVMKDVATRFRTLLYLDPSKVKEVGEKKKVDKVEITTYAPAKGGRTKGSKGTRRLSAQEKKNRDAIEPQVSAAVRRIYKKKGRYESKAAIAQELGISRNTLNNRLKSAGVLTKEEFYEIIRKVTND